MSSGPTSPALTPLASPPEAAPSPLARIFRASVLMAGSSVFSLLISLVRGKCVALLLGPSGVGLIGLLGTFNGSLSAFTGWGLGTSGVRTISGGPADEREAREAAVRLLGRRLAAVSLVVSLLAAPVACWLTFGNWDNLPLLLLSALAVPAMVMTGAWAVILQSAGQLRSLALNTIAGSLAGLLVGVPFIWWLGLPGVAVSLVGAAFAPALCSWWSASRHRPPAAEVSPHAEAVRQMLKMGGALMLVGLFAQLSAYLVRLALIQNLGLDAAGQYNAAFSIAGSLPSFVFAAMASDFYPRVAAAPDEPSAVKIVETQVIVGLILGVPALAALLALGDFCIHLFFSGEFDPAVSLMHWMVWGVFLRLVSWPYGYHMMARGSSKLIVAVEAVGGLILGGLPFLLIPWLGLKGSAVSFLFSYAFHCLLLMFALWKRTGCLPGPRVLLSVPLAALVLGLCQVSAQPLAGQPLLAAIPVAVVCLICGGAYVWANQKLKN